MIIRELRSSLSAGAVLVADAPTSGTLRSPQEFVHAILGNRGTTRAALWALSLFELGKKDGALWRLGQHGRALNVPQILIYSESQKKMKQSRVPLILTGWDRAIADFKKHIRKLELNIQTCEKMKADGEPWPGDISVRLPALYLPLDGHRALSRS